MNVAIINCFDNCEHRAMMLYDFFKGKGSNVTIYTSDYRHIAKKVRKEKKEDFKFIHVRPYKKNLSVERLCSHIGFAKSVFEMLKTQTVDLLWVIIPPNSCAKYAVKYKKKYGIKVIFDIGDMWPESMPIGEKYKKLFPFILWRKLRDDYLEYVDLIVTECDLYQRYFDQNIFKGKMQTLYLARNLRYIDCKEVPPADSVSLCYIGSINNIIDIPVISHIISELCKYKPVIINVIGDGESRDKLLDEAKKAGASVNYYGIIYDTEAKARIMSMSHYGLNIMQNTVRVGLTMKSIDYFEAGLPIINNIQGDTWEFCEKNGIGINIDESRWEQRVLYGNFDRKMIRDFAGKMFSKKAFDEKMKAICQKINK